MLCDAESVNGCNDDNKSEQGIGDGGGEINQDLLQPAPLEKSTGKATDGVGCQAPEDKNHQRNDYVDTKILEVIFGQALQVN